MKIIESLSATDKVPEDWSMANVIPSWKKNSKELQAIEPCASGREINEENAEGLFA